MSENQQQEQPQVPASKTASKNSTALIVVLVVLILVAAGFGGWFGIRPLLVSPSPSNTGGTPAPEPAGGVSTGPVNPRTVPFDPGAGLEVSSCCRMMGVWSDVAVVAVGVKGPPGSDGGGEILRGIAVTTGSILWTYDRTPEGKPFSAGPVMASGDRLAAGLVSLADGKRAGEYVVILSLAGGDVLGGRWFPVTETPAGTGSTVAETSLSAYVDGVVVVDRDETSEGPGIDSVTMWTMTQAYRDTDMEAPLWEASGSLMAEFHWHRSAKVLGGQTVLTAAGDYRSLSSGEPSHMALNDDVYMNTNGWVIGLGQSIRGWDDPMGAGPKWTYSLPDGQGFHGPPLAGCSTSDAVIVATYTTDETYTTSQTYLSAIHLADGQLIWSTPYAGMPTTCVVISRGDKEYVVVTSSSMVDFFDAGSGAALGEYDILGTSGMVTQAEISGAEPCGPGWACVLANGWDTHPDHKFVVTALTYEPGGPARQWSETTTVWGDEAQAFRSDAGLVIPTQPSIKEYEWLVV